MSTLFSVFFLLYSLMQIQYELLKTTLNRIFESYKWNSRQIKNSWKISPYKNKENKNKMVNNIFASDSQFKIMSKVISELLNTYLALSWGTCNEMKKKNRKNMGELLTCWI